MTELKHISVLLEESIKALNLNEQSIILDCTLGGGGHSSRILKEIPNGFLYAIDQDDLAINKATSILKKINSNFLVIKDNFVNIDNHFSEQSLDGILYDLGVSSFQFDLPERGFSYRFDGPLDMRMNQEQLLTAYEVVNNYSYEQLVKIFYEYGEEKYANFIAKRIVRTRLTKPIETTFELVDIIKSSIPAKELRKPGHPAKQVFQAIRIEVNHELDYLKTTLIKALKCLKVNGRLVVITFHSLEDRIVKNIFKDASTINLPKGLPYIPEGYEAKYQLVNHKVILPTEEELQFNTRAHSAKMRVIERIKE